MRWLVLSLLLFAGQSAAAERVPDALGLMVMLKVVSYDAAFGTHGSGEFVVLVPYAPGDESKATALAAVGGGLEVKTIKERTLRFVPVPTKDLPAAKGTAVLLYFGFPPDALKTVIEKTQREKQYVFTFEETSVHDGALLGVGLSNGKPQPLINIAAMRGLGADFGPVLRLARTFQ
ncbi:MAG: hypothetical protein Q8K32_02750 [Archangium sp.]|nr:hypothetical protein [Archangium sp.]